MDHVTKTIAVVFAVGAGTGLEPLTAQRTTAALPYGGIYRICDFALSNCLHAGLRQVLVLTQYKSHSLIRHLRDGWSVLNPELGEYITAVTPQSRSHSGLYQGEVDALIQNLYLLDRTPAEVILLLSGEQIYRMDYAALVAFHTSHFAEVTVAGIADAIPPGPIHCLLSPDGRSIDGLQLAEVWAEAGAGNGTDVGAEIGNGTEGDGAPERPALPGVMGVYAFDKALLVEMLRTLEAEGVATDASVEEVLLPRFLAAGRRCLHYPFGGTAGRVTPDRYWRRLASVDDYFAANMDLLQLDPLLDLYQEDWKIRTYQIQTPPARTVPGRSRTEGICVNSIVAGGAVIAGGGVNHSILCHQVEVRDDAIVEDSILLPEVTVGEGAQLRGCIVDKNVVVPPGTRVGHDPDEDRARFFVSPGGVAVIPRDYRFP